MPSRQVISCGPLKVVSLQGYLECISRKAPYVYFEKFMSKQVATPSRPAARTTTGSTTTTRTRTSARNTVTVRPFQMPFERENLMIVLGGVAVIALGYLLMAMSPTMSFVALTLAPFLLVLGYAVIVPYGIMYGSRKKKEVVVQTSSAAPANL